MVSPFEPQYSIQRIIVTDVCIKLRLSNYWNNQLSKAFRTKSVEILLYITQPNMAPID